MIVRFFLAFAVALHRIATTLRIVAVEAEVAQANTTARNAYTRYITAVDGVEAMRRLSESEREEFVRQADARDGVCSRNAQAVSILKSSVL